MSRPADACRGGENAAFRAAWDAYDLDAARWDRSAQHAITKATAHAQDRARIPATNDLTPTQIEALKLPERPEHPNVTYTVGDPYFCSRCKPRIRRAISEVDRLAALLDSWADGHRGATSGEKIGRSSTAPASPSPIANDLDTLYQEMTDAEDEWRQARGYIPVYRGSSRGARHRDLAIAFIAEHLTEIFLSEDHVGFCLRILWWERTLLSKTKTDPVVRSRPGRCPRCRLVNVLVTRDDGYTVCTNDKCGRLLHEDEYQRDVLHVADHSVVAETQQARAGSA
jgi:hypothetical protein